MIWQTTYQSMTKHIYKNIMYIPISNHVDITVKSGANIMLIEHRKTVNRNNR